MRTEIHSLGVQMAALAGSVKLGVRLVGVLMLMKLIEFVRDTDTLVKVITTIGKIVKGIFS